MDEVLAGVSDVYVRPAHCRQFVMRLLMSWQGALDDVPACIVTKITTTNSERSTKQYSSSSNATCICLQAKQPQNWQWHWQPQAILRHGQKSHMESARPVVMHVMQIPDDARKAPAHERVRTAALQPTSAKNT